VEVVLLVKLVGLGEAADVEATEEVEEADEATELDVPCGKDEAAVGKPICTTGILSAPGPLPPTLARTATTAPMTSTLMQATSTTVVRLVPFIRGCALSGF